MSFGSARAGFVAAVLLITLILPTAAEAQFTFVTNGGSITITKYTGSTNLVIVPSMINQLAVAGIGDAAFSSSSVASVIIPDTVTSIGGFSFKSCFSLTNVTMANSVTNIGGGAFESCSGLSSIVIPSGLASIGAAAFYGTKIPSVIIPTGVTSIPNYTFQLCTSLTNLVIPDTVTNIGNSVFQGCIKLSNVWIGDGVRSIGADAFSQCTSVGSITIPSTITNLGDYAFGGCTGLTNIYFVGDAPTTSTPVFAGANATVYFLPGTTGWDSMFGGMPTMLWNPLIQTGDDGFGVRSNLFGFNITGTSNTVVVVEASTNLASSTWQALQTITLTGSPAYFGDPQWTNHPARAYRLHWP